MGRPDTNSYSSYVKAFLSYLAVLVLFAVMLLIPYSCLWLHESGDVAVERAVAAQSGEDFILFGSGLSQDFVDYKLQLYASVKPDIVTIGSSRVMQFRGGWFREKYTNMGGVAGNLAVLRSTIDAMLAIHKPTAVIIGLDFWWFLPQWESHPENHVPPTSGSYNYSLSSLKKPWEWLLEGKISLHEFLAPITGVFGEGFRTDRYGIMAQQSNDGFGPDGSWYYTAEITGQKPALDYGFKDTLGNIERGTRAFYHAGPEQTGPAEAHINAFAEIWCKLKTRGIHTFVFIPPLAKKVLARMDATSYPHLYELRKALLSRGIDVLDLTDPAVLGASDCEFVDGFHGGDVLYARILRQMADSWPRLLPYVNMERLDTIIRADQGHAFSPDPRLTERPEIDFLGLGCPKRAK